MIFFSYYNIMVTKKAKSKSTASKKVAQEGAGFGSFVRSIGRVARGAVNTVNKKVLVPVGSNIYKGGAAAVSAVGNRQNQKDFAKGFQMGFRGTRKVLTGAAPVIGLLGPEGKAVATGLTAIDPLADKVGLGKKKPLRDVVKEGQAKKRRKPRLPRAKPAATARRGVSRVQRPLALDIPQYGGGNSVSQLSYVTPSG